MRIFPLLITIMSLVPHMTVFAQDQENVQFIKDSLYFYSIKDSVKKYWNQNPDKLEALTTRLVLFSKEKNHKPWLAIALGNHGYALQKKGGTNDLEKSIEILRRTIIILNELNDLRNLANCYNSLSVSYIKLNSYPEALETILQANEIYKKLKKTDTSSYLYKRFGNSYNNLAIVYKNLSLHNKSLKAWDSALFYYEKSNSKYGANAVYLNLTDFHFKQKQYDKALVFALQAYEGFKSIQIKEGQIASTINLVELYEATDQNKQAIKYAKQGLKFSKGSNYRSYQILSYIQLSKNFLQLKDIDSATFYIGPAIRLSDSLQLLDLQKQSKDLQGQIAEQQGDNLEALRYYRQAAVLQDSLEQRQDIQKATKIVLDKEHRDYKKKIAALEKVVDKKNNWLYGVALGILFSGLLGYMFLKKYQKSRTKQLQLENTVQAQREEKDYLHRKLVSSTASLAIKDELLTEINALLNDIKTLTNLNGFEKDLNHAQIHIKDNLELNKAWEEFFLHFEKVHPDFIERLKSNYDLTANDLKLCAFIKMNLSNKEISNILNVKLNTVHVSISRLKKKLNTKDKSVFDFLHSKSILF